MKKTNLISILNIVCALLMVVTFVTQLLPYWTCLDCNGHPEETKDISLAEFVWLPGHHEGMKDQMTDLYKDTYGKNYRFPDGRKFKFLPNEVLPTVLPAFLGSIFGIILCVVLRKKFFVAALPLYIGISGIIGYSSCLALTVGQNVGIYLILACVLTAVAALTVALGAIAFIRKKLHKHPAE